MYTCTLYVYVDPAHSMCKYSLSDSVMTVLLKWYDISYSLCSRSLYKEWESNYESLSQMVVPRSSQKITEDSEYGLFSVTVFKKVVDEYKHHAREKK